jgi:putative Holliday junction resolvase
LTRRYVEDLKEHLDFPFLFYDERYSTAAAMGQQRERGVSEKRGRSTLDAGAAAVILQDFLDSLTDRG